ncbi:ParB/RepB/Spo0J family partition protein [Trabulsiella odontotermitis]|uniref:ParB/RepB/Spo0J family partition protein n=1 Tax=Trabulsiella odontotermitis TaxID=379893 RepID=UPI0006BA3243|nr:DNA-binding protein [Trabulsiella odontotermitis]
MTTLSQLYKQKDKNGTGTTVKKTFMVPTDELYLEEGSNIRPVEQEHAEYMRDCWIDGSDLPPLSVEVTEQGIKIIDGQHRFIGAKLAIAMGHDIPRIECRDFVGTELDKLAHMAKSSQGKPITPLQRAGAYNRARNQGHTSAEIARAFGRSVADVETHLQLLSSGDVLIGMVESGEVAATTAIALSREHGPKAGTVATESLAKAKAAGKKKLTRSAAIPQFSAVKARQFIQSIVDCEDAIVLPPEATVILEEYKAFLKDAGQESGS